MTVQLPSSTSAEQAALAVLNAATDQMPKPAEGASAEAIARAEAEAEAEAFMPTYSLPRSPEPPLRTSLERAERTAEAEAKTVEEAEAEAKKPGGGGGGGKEAEAEAGGRGGRCLRERATVERALELVELAKTRPLSDAEAAEAEALSTGNHILMT